MVVNVGARWLAAAWLVAAGCGRLSFDADASADASADAPYDPNDRDGDGIASADDDCPDVADPLQANEDGDAWGDACDPCPPIADVDPPADRDGDGLGDACDPSPDSPGDKIVAFEGFDAAPTGWTVVGRWGFAGGRALASSSLNEVGALVLPVREVQAGVERRFTVSASATIDDLYGTDVARAVGVVQQLVPESQTETPALSCVFGLNPTNDEVFALADNATTTKLDDVPSPGLRIGVSSSFELAHKQQNNYLCTGSRAARTLNATYAPSTSPNFVGLHVRSAAAHFYWVLIVESPISSSAAP